MLNIKKWKELYIERYTSKNTDMMTIAFFFCRPVYMLSDFRYGPINFYEKTCEEDWIEMKNVDQEKERNKRGENE